MAKSKTKSYAEQLKSWLKPSDFEKAGKKFDQEMRTIMREIQQYNAREAISGIDNMDLLVPERERYKATVVPRIRDAAIEYLNALARKSGDIPVLTPKMFASASGITESRVAGPRKGFESACKGLYNHMREMSQGKGITMKGYAGKQKDNSKDIAAPQFAEDRHNIITTLIGFLIACAGAVCAHKKDLLSFVETHTNSQGAKIAVLAVGSILGTAVSAKLTHKLFVGDTDEAKAAIETANRACSNLENESFASLAKAVNAWEKQRSEGKSK